MVWRGASLVPLSKEKGDNVNVLTREAFVCRVLWVSYMEVFIKRLKAETECAIAEGQCWFRFRGNQP